MREIKFRAWGGGVIIPWEWLDKSLNDVWTALNAQQYTNPDPVLMQYTGLKDKNGVDVYESDVVKNDRGETSIIEWGCFPNMAGFQVTSPYINIFDSKSIEIIGNIYESPELLDE